MSASFPHLFSPVKLGPRRAPNRVMRLATTTNLGEQGRISDRMVAFYRRLAQAQVGSLVTESLRVHGSGRARGTTINIFAPEIVPSLRKLAEAVHEEGSLLIAQLNHGGRQHHAHAIPPLWGPSPIACPHSGGVPHEMTLAEVEEVIDAFVRSAVNARDAGVDGVEIHGAQGHLIQQFVSPFSNQRTDEYGGSFENRLRFPREIVQRVRQAVGKDFVVGYRLGVEEFAPGGITLEDSKRITRQLAALGAIDYLSLSQGNFATIETHLPDRHAPLGVYRDLHRQIKAEAGDVPVVTCTRIQTPEQAEEILAAGEADLVGLCRALIADQDWARKATDGRSEQIRLCIGCNQCWGWITEGQPVTCVHNPTMLAELELGPIKPVETPRRVVVVGGGPGGLEAARVAAERGHTVTLFERGDELGGQIHGAANIPGQGEVGNVLRFLVPQVEQLGVDVRLNTEATVESILAEQPDAVIVATGADPALPFVQTDGSVPLVPSLKLEDFEKLGEGRLVVMDEDGYFWASEVAEMLADLKLPVTVVTRFFEVFRELPAVTRPVALRVLDDLGVEMKPNSEVDRIEDGSVVLKHFYSKREERIPNAGGVVWIGNRQANGRLGEDLRRLGAFKVQVIGDAVQPRRLANAIQEGHRAGRSV